jgi:hypothetical protein
VSFLFAALLAASSVGCSREAELAELLLRYERRYRAFDSNGVEYNVEEYHLRRSVDKGRTWVDLGAIPARGYPAWGYALACGGDDVLHFVHVGSGKGKKAVFVSRSSDGGTTWTDPEAVNDEAWAQRSDPTIVTRGGEMVVAWTERSERGPSGDDRPGGVYVTCSRNGGLGWDDDRWMREGEDCCLSVGEDGSVYLAYIGGELGSVVYVSYSDDGGRSWHSETPGELKMVMKEPYALSMGKRLYLIFKGARPSLAHLSYSKDIEYETYFRHSSDRGETWSGVVELEKKVGG